LELERDHPKKKISQSLPKKNLIHHIRNKFNFLLRQSLRLMRLKIEIMKDNKIKTQIMLLIGKLEQ